MTKLEAKCKNMADICALAHSRTVGECRKKSITVDVQDRSNDGVKYSYKAQSIFNKHYDRICERTGL